MAQAGFTPISLYYSTTSTQEPAAADLVSGELAINIADGKLFYKNSGGNVRLLSIGYGSSTVTPTNGGVQYGTGTALALTAAGSSGQILRSNGAAAPSWADLSTLGVNTISFGTTGLTPNSATAGAVTVAGTLVTANGGTGLGGATPFTANGVLYASSASALTSGAALTFDGTNLGVGTASPASLTGGASTGVAFNGSSSVELDLATAGVRRGYFYADSNVAEIGTVTGSIPLKFTIGLSEQMRLTSTGLGIGTTSPSVASGLGIAINGGAGQARIALKNTNTGDASGDGFQLAVDTSSNAYVDQRENAALIFNTNNTERARIDSSGNLLVGTTTTPTGFSNRIITSVISASAANPSVVTYANGSATSYHGIGTSNNQFDIVCLGTNNSIVFYNGADGTTPTERARITSGGELLVGTTTAAINSKLDVLQTTAATAGIGCKATNSNAQCFVAWNSDTSGDNTFAQFYTETSATSRGSITYNRAGGLVAYNTTSDYRAKDIIGPVTDAGVTIDALKVYNGKMKGATVERPMLIAHEAQEVTPYAVTGEKDAVNDHGTPKYQQMDVSSFVPLLIAEIQSLRQRVAQLEGA